MTSELPGTQGDRVLAIYTGGKGGGKHYYKGLITKWNYKVKYGEYYYVDPRDAKFDGDKTSRSLFIRVQRDDEKVKKAEPKKVEEPKVVERTPRKSAPEKKPVEFYKPKERPLPDIVALRWREDIRHMEFTSVEARKLLAIEKSGKGRVRVIGYLEKFLDVE